MKPFKNMLTSIQTRLLQPIIRKRSFQLGLLVLFIFLSVGSIFVLSLSPEKVDVRLGQRAPQDIYATKTIEDIWTTEDLRNEAANAVESQYRIDSTVLDDVKSGIETAFRLLYALQEDPFMSLEEKVVAFHERSSIRLDEDEILDLLETPIEDIEFFENYLYEISVERLNRGIRIEEIQQVREMTDESIRDLNEYPASLISFSVRVIRDHLRPNEFYDAQRTEELKQQARDQVDPITIRQDEMLVREGERITNNQIQVLRELGLLFEEGSFDYQLYIGIGLIMLLLFFVYALYLRVFHGELYRQPSKLWMIALIFVITLGASKVLSVITVFMVPVATNGMLLSILINPKVAIISNLIIAIATTLVVGNDLTLLIMLLLGGTIGALMAQKSQQRGNIFFTGIVVAIINFLVILGIGLLSSLDLLDITMNAFYGFIGGIFASVLTIGTLPFWEWGFNILTHLKLLELSNPNQKLIKKLLIEAPGTYHHSIIVGNLSETAAEAVGGNGLLARVGAFYHDIGKTKRPYFFKENQIGSDNPHDKLSPSLSSLIITGHIKDGVEIAKKHKIHHEIIDFIKTHHGDTLVAYFYHKAKEERKEEDEAIDPQNFRYGGPKPRTKETAIVMLADSVEAAVRSINEPDHEKVENLIDKIFQSKLDDGQLEDCNLTLKEIKKIKEVFVSTMVGIFHERIEYPDDE